MTPQQYRRLVGRLDAFEHAAQEREKREETFRRDVIDANGYQLEEMKRSNGLREKEMARWNYIAKTLEARPCVANEANNGEEKCPEGL